MSQMPPQTLACQRHLFDLETDDVFLNGAYMSPQLKAVYAAGMHGLSRKNRPSRFKAEDFFEPVAEVQELFAKLIHCSEPERIALIPSVSYGMATVAANLNLRSGQNIVLPVDQFPSNYYSWSRLCAERGAELRLVPCPEDSADRSAAWTTALLDAIDEKTAMLACAHIHWADGTLYDLKSLRVHTRNMGAWLVIDGTQSVGALPFSVEAFEPDALICAGYKWLMGPYSTGYAYYGPVFDLGNPIEENWINRQDSHNFKDLVNYQEHYRPGAARYSVGEQSNFVFIPMQIAALQQLLAWTPEAIQEYCSQLWATVIPKLAQLGIHLHEKRAEHLVGFSLPDRLDADRLRKLLEERRIKVSFRGESMRVSPNVYNREDELGHLVEALGAAMH
ncbi:MAG: aminotransferase class V-fold PLP-dependent enzyme [Bacteroidota bacterium]